ncbi:MAG TPA: hypothetical protein VMA72_21125 [Streptosporangiaceae bacterium]|nr:hypothetical protein [Streptosporangiaceae bacterium]
MLLANGRAGVARRGPGWIGVMAVALLGVVCLATAGCTGGSAGSGSTAASGATNVRSTSYSPPPGAPLLPMFAYLQTTAEYDTYVEAYNILVARCMLTYGFVDPHQVYAGPTIPSMYRRYGLTDTAAARKWGYQMPPALMVTKPPISPGESTRAWNYVLAGGTAAQVLHPNGKPVSYGGKKLPAGGCSGAANRALGEARVSGLTLAQQLMNTAYSQSLTSSAVVAAITKWSACMAAHGFNYSSPYGPFKTFSADPVGSTPSKLETDTAVADIGCKRKTNLVAIWYGVEKGDEETSIQQNFAALTALKSELARTQAAALHVIAGSAS